MLWQNRPLEPVYTFLFMDAIHYKVGDNSKIKNKAAYVVLGVKDVLIFSVDDLPGFKEAISTSYPESTIQRCNISKFIAAKIINHLQNSKNLRPRYN